MVDENKTTMGYAWDAMKIVSMTYGFCSIYGAIATGGIVGGVGGLLSNAGVGASEALGDLGDGASWVGSFLSDATAPAAALDPVPQIV